MGTTSIGNLPIKSHVCSFAIFNLWIIEGVAVTPLGIAVFAPAGDTIALEPFDRAPGVEGMVLAAPFKCG